MRYCAKNLPIRASIGCPSLENHAFLPDNLDARLDDAAKAFITNPDKVRLDEPEKNCISLQSLTGTKKISRLQKEHNKTWQIL